ncbi:MAG TPA: glycosyltransferase [Terriglobia bacterium]|nr:glycosyltransferase [Terriglobia bacterium]
MSPDAPLSIAHIDTGLELRGGQRQLLLLAHGLRQRGHSQAVVCAEAGELCDRAKADGFPVLALPQDDFKHISGIRQLRRRVNHDALMLLHAHDGVGQTVSWLASWGTGARRVATRRVTYLPRRRIDYRLKYSYTCHAVVAVSHFIGRMIEEAGIPPAMINVIPDGIEIPEGAPDAPTREAARARWGITENEFAVGSLAGISPEKGLDLALKALELLADRLPNAKLVLGGEITAEELAASGLAAGVARGQVLLAGYQENVFEFFAGLDVYIMPSRSEGLGSAALMAMAHAVPVIAARVGGLPEIVDDGKTGWLVAPESPDSVAQAIADAVNNPATLKELGANARLRSVEFSADIMVERTEALYRRLMGCGPPKDAVTAKKLRANG